jgi:hypothetical protein
MAICSASTSFHYFLQGTRFQGGGGGQVCRKVGRARACSQSKGIFLYLETRRSGSGQRNLLGTGEVPPLGVDHVPFGSHLRLLFRDISRSFA